MEENTTQQQQQNKIIFIKMKKKGSNEITKHILLQIHTNAFDLFEFIRNTDIVDWDHTKEPVRNEVYRQNILLQIHAKLHIPYSI